MIGVPVDAWYVWLGLSLASIALLGVGATLPTAPPPAAADAADTVDRTAATAHPATAEHPLDATAVRVGPRRLGLRNDAGTTHAAFAFGPVTPATGSRALRAVLRGAPPATRFESGSALCDASADARDRAPRWRPVDGPLIARHVVWEGCDVTLVG
ncbi:DUF7283 family protein [Haloplanus aerogenes]|uniref:Uncharacterized protein n=1 Tax=Haloplanus aerogenes TaxID=660522 RepID=A0A3M0CY88_9EURY|nr:hypothetical protein [Haloplanus aerogenes]AZH24959.1 hypothetical protein DU502_06060 [Haloplanus aerogenes]RMB13824.1 hypothetical protein ATH50_2266 [Haloplanus aerogenes]